MITFHHVQDFIPNMTRLTLNRLYEKKKLTQFENEHIIATLKKTFRKSQHFLTIGTRDMSAPFLHFQK